MIYQVNSKSREILADFFEDIIDSSVYSCLKGNIGEAWVDNLGNPTMVELVIGEKVFFAGKPNGEEAEELLLNIPFNSVIITKNKGWKKLIESFYEQYLNSIDLSRNFGYILNEGYSLYNIRYVS